jgi:multicomponent Na+:H+ antiporter subunit D
VLFFGPAMNLAGIPPFSGFIGKLGLFTAGVEHGGWLAYVLVGLGTVTSLLTLYVMARVWNLVFWRSPEDAEDPDPALTAQEVRPLLPAAMVGATVATVSAGVALAVVAGPLWAVTSRAAEELVDPGSYVAAVFPDGIGEAVDEAPKLEKEELP